MQIKIVESNYSYLYPSKNAPVKSTTEYSEGDSRYRSLSINHTAGTEYITVA